MKKFLSIIIVLVMLIGLISTLITANASGVIPTERNSEGWDWYDANMNGMGWVTGVVACPTAPYAIYAKTDVGGLYRLDRNQSLNGKQGYWIPLLESFGSDRANYSSVESIAVDPNDGMVVYFAGGNDGAGEIFKSADGGETWASTNFTAQNVHMAGNGDGRSETGERLRVDPNNTNILYFASRQNGLWRYDGANWSKVTAAGLPAAAGRGYTYVAFDKNGGTQPDGSTSAFYVGVDTRGVYVTNDGGASFTLAGGVNPANPRAGAVNDNGIFVTTSADGVYSMTRGGSLTKLNDTASSYGLSLDVHNQDFVALGLSAGDNMYRIGADGSLTWTRKMVNGEPIAYAQYNGWCHPERGGFAIDPADPTGNTGFAGTGFGVVRASDMAASKTSGNVVWDDFTQGIGELVVNFVKVAPIVYENGGLGPDFQFASADMGGFSVVDRTKVPGNRIMLGNTKAGTPEWNVPLTIGTGWDYCWRYPQYMVYTGTHQFSNDNALKYGASRDGGLTWEELHISASDKPAYGIADPAESHITGGVIAMSSANPYNLVWSPDLGFPKWSDDMGQTWNDPVNIYDLKGSYSYNGKNTLYERSMYWWANAQSLQSDKVKGDTFYLFTSKDGTDAQFWRSTDGGKNWTLQYEGNKNGGNDPGKINYYYTPSAKADVNPVAQGDVFIGVWRSTNKDCTDFAKVPNVQTAYSVGFGAGDLPDKPWIYIYGKANGDTNFGIYVSKDNGRTWEKITDDSEQLYGVNSIEGDMRQRGLVYIGRGGRGVTVGEIDGGAVDVSAWYVCRDCEISGGNYVGVCKHYAPASGNFKAWHSSAKYPADTKSRLLAPKSAAAGEELLKNGGFSEGLEQWFMYDWADGSMVAQRNIVNTPGDYGSRYLEIAGRRNNWDSLAQGVDSSKITAGEYTVSGWVYLPGANSIKLGLHFPDATAKDLFLPVVTTVGEWVYVTGVIEVTADNLNGPTGEIQFAVSTVNGNTSAFYVANLSLKMPGGITPQPQPTDGEILINADFSVDIDDTAGPDGWYTYWHTKNVLSVVETPGEYGDRYLAVSGRASQWESLMQPGWYNSNLASWGDFKIKADVTYKLSAWIYLEENTAALRLGLEFIDTGDNSTGKKFIPAVTKTGEWVYAEGNVAVTAQDLTGCNFVQFIVETPGEKNGNFRIAGPSLMKISTDLKPDKTKLQELYNECKNLKASDYTTESWATFQNAYAKAKTVLEKPGTTQQDINETLKILKSAFDGLVEYKTPHVLNATPSASVEKLKGNKNNLTITITEKLSNGTTNTIKKTFTIENNAAGTYEVGDYKVYVDTKGNTQVRECYIVE